MSSEPNQKQWVFPVTPCPRCHGYNTEATHTDSDKGVQSRKCRVAICRRTYQVKGIPAEPPKEDQTSKIKDQKLVCPKCGKTYSRQADLTKHIHRNHS